MPQVRRLATPSCGGLRLLARQTGTRPSHMWPNRAAGYVWKMAHIIRDRYGGDARKIWEGQPTSQILQRLTDATFGPELSHMVDGALRDTGQVEGKGRLKADLNVTRVLGRVFTGSKAAPDEAHDIADIMEPGKQLDI